MFGHKRKRSKSITKRKSNRSKSITKRKSNRSKSINKRKSSRSKSITKRKSSRSKSINKRKSSRSKSINKRKSIRRKSDGGKKSKNEESKESKEELSTLIGGPIMASTTQPPGEREGEREGEMVKLKGDEEWEECAICMEPTNFDAITSRYWLCCGQRICAKCDAHQISFNKGERRNCPFCRSPEIYDDEPKFQTQLLMFAEKGKAWAQCYLGDRYLEGKYVEKNMEKAINFFNLASEQGHPIAHNNLGLIYSNGEGVPVDYEKALHYYKLAAEGGSTTAYSNIGIMYGHGLGVTKSDEKAFQNFKVAADKGDEVAQHNLGVCYYNGVGVEKDISLAIKYYTLSADQGYENAIKHLANVLIEETEKESKYLFEAICRTKNALKIIKESDEDFTKFKDFIETSKTVCGGCGAKDNKTNLLTCGRCKVIFYCNINCQKKHWKGGHKQECKELEKK